MKQKFKKQIAGVVTTIFVLTIALLLDKFGIVDISNYLSANGEKNDINEQIFNINDANYYDVVRVVDGDTFVIDYNGKNEKVRLIGIDTPESVHPNQEKNTEFGYAVSNYSKKMLTGKKVQIELDVEYKDKYGRLLAYVYIDGQMYNKILLEKGYAKIATYPPNVKYADEFTKIQKRARENKMGMWAY